MSDSITRRKNYIKECPKLDASLVVNMSSKEVLEMFQEINKEYYERFEEESRLEALARRKIYDGYMEKCEEKYPEFFEKCRFSPSQEKTRYILLFLYDKSKRINSKRVICSKSEIMRYYWSQSSEGVSRNITTLVKDGYIKKWLAADENGRCIGNEYLICEENFH